MSLLPFLYNHSGLLRREIQPIQPTPIIHHNRLYANFSLVLPNLFFLFQQCFVSRQVVGVGRVGTNRRSLRWALRRPPRCSAPPLARGARSRASLGGASPPARPSILTTRIIYDGNDSINNSRKPKKHPPAGAQPPAKPQNERSARVEGLSSVVGGATPRKERSARLEHIF